jgi:hypothetical protein
LSPWIFTEHEKPPILTEVLVYRKHLPEIALFYSDGGGNTRDGTPILLNRIKLWAKLLPIPKEVSEPINTKISKPLFPKAKRNPSQIFLNTEAGQRSRPRQKEQRDA